MYIVLLVALVLVIISVVLLRRRAKRAWLNEMLQCDYPFCGRRAPRRQMVRVMTNMDPMSLRARRDGERGALIASGAAGWSLQNYCSAHDNRCGLDIDADSIPAEPLIRHSFEPYRTERDR